jgi:hypothetical protein
MKYDLIHKMMRSKCMEPDTGANGGSDTTPTNPIDNTNNVTTNNTEVNNNANNPDVNSENAKLKEQILQQQIAFEQKMRTQMEEADKMSKMDENQKLKYQYEKMQAEYDKLVKERTHNEMSSKAKDLLNTKGLPSDFVDFLVADTAEATNANISKFEQLFNNHLQNEINKRLGVTASTPKAGASALGGSITLDSFMAMSFKEKSELRANNPELYTHLTSQILK